MKKTSILILSILLLFLTSCQTGYDRFAKLTTANYKVTDAKDIELFFTDHVERKYDPIGFVFVYLPNFELIAKDQTSTIEKMKNMAAENGADAVMKVEIEAIGHGYSLKGLAIKWK
jgi:hypothetical protein